MIYHTGSMGQYPKSVEVGLLLEHLCEWFLISLIWLTLKALLDPGVGKPWWHFDEERIKNSLFPYST